MIHNKPSRAMSIVIEGQGRLYKSVMKVKQRTQQYLNNMVNKPSFMINLELRAKEFGLNLLNNRI